MLNNEKCFKKYLIENSRNKVHLGKFVLYTYIVFRSNEIYLFILLRTTSLTYFKCPCFQVLWGNRGRKYMCIYWPIYIMHVHMCVYMFHICLCIMIYICINLNMNFYYFPNSNPLQRGTVWSLSLDSLLTDTPLVKKLSSTIYILKNHAPKEKEK